MRRSSFFNVCIHKYVFVFKSTTVHVSVVFPSDTVEVSVALLVGISDQINYLLDAVSLVEIPRDPEWREHADQRIQKIRKGTVTFK